MGLAVQAYLEQAAVTVRTRASGGDWERWTRRRYSNFELRKHAYHVQRRLSRHAARRVCRSSLCLDMAAYHGLGQKPWGSRRVEWRSTVLVLFAFNLLRLSFTNIPSWSVDLWDLVGPNAGCG